MYDFDQESGHIVWREQWYALTLGISWWIDIYMIRNDQVFVANVVVIDLTWESMALNVNSWLIGVATKLSTNTKICNYKTFHERHHFILMAMEVHDAPKYDIDHFIKECVCLFHDRQLGGHLSLSFCIQFSKHHVSVTLQHVLAFVINKKIALVSDFCSRPPITI
jgi:hypothetical protein